MPTLEPTTLRASLKQNRRKLTRARQAVLDILATADRHLTPAEIYRRAKATHPHLGLTTVYRTLDLLAELGYIQRVHTSDGCHSYAPSAHTHGHQLICAVCGRTEEFSDCDLAKLIQTLQRKTGFEINVHMLELVGRCPSCQTKRGARRK
ncbi:MAG: transcriptional repressor [Anaerolineae bacterium]|nr:transcriptional repressor [Anaerolineae bacterium]